MTRLTSDVRHAFRSVSLRRGSALRNHSGVCHGYRTFIGGVRRDGSVQFSEHCGPPRADELVVISVGLDGLTPESPLPTVNDWSRQTHLFKSVAAHEPGGTERVRLSDRSVSLYTRRVSANFFDVLGVAGPTTSIADSESHLVLTEAGRRAMAGPGITAVASAPDRRGSGSRRRAASVVRLSGHRRQP